MKWSPGQPRPAQASPGASRGPKMDPFRFLNLGPKMDPKMDPRRDLKRDPKIDPKGDPPKWPKCCNYNVFGNSGPPFRRFSGAPSRPNRVPTEGSIWDLFRGSENHRKHCIYNVWEAFRTLNREPILGARKGPPKGPKWSPIGDPNWTPNRSPNRSPEGGPFGAQIGPPQGPPIFRI